VAVVAINRVKAESQRRHRDQEPTSAVWVREEDWWMKTLHRTIRGLFCSFAVCLILATCVAGALAQTPATPSDLPPQGHTPMDILVPLFAVIITGLGTYLWRHAEHEKLIRSKDAEHEKLIAEERQKLSDFQASVTYYSYEDHGVLVDGAPAAGKSAIVAKWADPTVDIQKLGKTAVLAKLGIYLCSQFFERGARKLETRHRLKFLDIPGEHFDVLLPAIVKERPKFIMLVVDPTRETESFERLNPGHIRTLYANETVAEMVAGLLVYISKTDAVEDATISRVRERVDKEIVPYLKPRHPNAYVFAGSASSGHGLHDGLAYMIKQLGLQSHYVKHQSLTT
jgi:hypothetical protein